jgi:hypothetical protein
LLFLSAAAFLPETGSEITKAQGCTCKDVRMRSRSRYCTFIVVDGAVVLDVGVAIVQP